MGSSIFIFLGLLIFLAHIFNALFSKRRIPDVLLLLGIGIVIGPVLHLVTPESLGEMGSIFASLTLLFILFDSGVDMSIDSLRKSWKGFVQVTFLSFLLSMTTIAIIGHQMGFEWQSAWLLGSMLAGTAAAIVIPLVKQLKVSEYTATVLQLESALSAVLCIVVSITFIDAFKIGTMDVGSIFGNVLASVILSLVLGVMGGIVWSGFLDRIRRLQNSMFLTAAFVFVVYGIAEVLGYSGAISALAFGIVLGNVDYFDFAFIHKIRKHDMIPLLPGEKSFFKELVFVFKTFFFVYIGICIPFTNTTALLYGALITIALFVVRFLLLAIVGRNNLPNDRLVVSMMIPKGLASAVLASIPEQVNLELGYALIPGATMIKYVTYAVIFFSIIGTSLLVFFTRRRLVRDIVPSDSVTSSNTPEEPTVEAQQDPATNQAPDTTETNTPPTF